MGEWRRRGDVEKGEKGNPTTGTDILNGSKYGERCSSHVQGPERRGNRGGGRIYIY